MKCRVLEKKECDIIARNIPITSEVSEKYLFTDPIVFNKQVLIQRTAKANNGIEPLRNQLHLAGKIIYIPKTLGIWTNTFTVKIV